ncbi:MAG: PAQR family membrane homeostasis protein TrhA, partial [Halofilum sp. (in: g-proteobacteria)]
ALPGIADPFSVLTHGLGAAVALAMARRLIARGRGRGARTALAVFAGSCILVLATSATYHVFGHGTAVGAVFQRLDHAAIFVLIAGTFTPVHAILFRGPWRWAVLAAVWSAVLIAIPLKTVFFDALPESIGLSIYLAMGWLGAGTVWILWRHRGFGLIRPALAGGLAYTIGALVGVAGTPDPLPGVIGSHELFHCASLAGVWCFWRFMGAVARTPAIGRPLARPRGPAYGADDAVHGPESAA